MGLFDFVARLGPDQLVLLIPIVAVIVGGILGLTKLVFRHRERMAMIEQGMHPDLVEPEEEAGHSPEA